jgi:hypothetical protein
VLSIQVTPVLVNKIAPLQGIEERKQVVQGNGRSQHSPPTYRRRCEEGSRDNYDGHMPKVTGTVEGHVVTVVPARMIG